LTVERTDNPKSTIRNPQLSVPHAFLRHGWGTREWLVAAVALLCYANTLSNGYVYDSIEVVERNPMVHEPHMWLELWTVDHWYQEEGRTANRDLLYRPVALASYRLVRTLAGPHPLPQHLANVLLHALISVLVVRLMLQVGGGATAAFAGGMLFAVLPIHTEVVNDVVGRTDLLATLGVLLALSAHRRLIRSRTVANKVGWAAVASLSAFCALGSKEIGISVLGLIPLFDLWWCRRSTCGDGFQAVDPGGRECLSPDSARDEVEDAPWRTRGSFYAVVRLVYLVVPVVGYFTLRYHALGGQLYQQPAATKTINVLVDAPLWQRTLGVLQAWGMYWRKTVWPDVLCPDYSMNTVRLATGPWQFDVLIGICVGVALIAATILAWRRGNRAVALCVGALVLCFAPASNAFGLIQVFFAERIWYLPSVWAMILLAAAVVVGGRRPRGAALQVIPGRASLAVFVLVCVAMFTRCWVRNPEWKSNATVAAAAHRDHPDSVATLAMYGNLLATSGDVEGGLRLLNQAVEIDPGFTVAHRALGQAYMLAGDDQRSLHYWRIAQMQFPGHPDTRAALRILGDRLASWGQVALAELKQAADDRPRDLEAELRYVRKLLELARHREALARLEATEKRFADRAAWQQQYGAVLLYSGNKDGAIGRYRKALRLATEDVSLYVDLAALLMEREKGNDLTEARDLLERAHLLTPDEPNISVLRAELLALEGDIFGALAVYRELLQSLPADHPQRRLWETRAKVLGGE
jgi:tetratricopeptide (TPR) repeat protein